MNIFEPNYAAAELGLASADGVQSQLLSEEEKRRKRMQQAPLDPFGNTTQNKDQSQIAPGMPAAWKMLGLR